MKIVTLIENTDGGTDLMSEHGLCLYVETEKHRVLVDTGQTGAALDNAEKLGIDLSLVDTLVLSHGHYDHTGGVLRFAELNPKARIYMQKTAVLEYISTSGGSAHYIGINPGIPLLPQIQYLSGEEVYVIDEELELFAGITGRTFWPVGNRTLFRRENGTDVPDVFDHEQCLVVKSGGKQILLSGCAHNGILNILDRYRAIYGRNPDALFSGFHMMKKTGYDGSDIEVIRSTAEILKQTGILCYTGHCTSLPGYEIMKEIMGDQLQYMHTGLVVTIGQAHT